jgi:hypothetical protein
MHNPQLDLNPMTIKFIGYAIVSLEMLEVQLQAVPNQLIFSSLFPKHKLEEENHIYRLCRKVRRMMKIQQL